MRFCFVFGQEPWLLPPALEMASVLEEMGHKVSVLYAEALGMEPQPGDMELPMQRVSKKARGFGKLLLPFRLASAVRRELRSQPTDVTLACDLVALHAVAPARGLTPLLGYWGFEDTTAPTGMMPSLTRYRMASYPAWLRHMDFYLAPSPTRLERIAAAGGTGTPGEVILNCRALRSPTSTPAFNTPRLDHFEVKLIHSGRISHTQGVGEIVEAMASLPQNVALVIAGIGHPDYVEVLRKRAEEQGSADRIFFLGRLGRGATYELLRTMDIGFVLYQERAGERSIDPAPNKLADYIASGVHVVSSNQPYMRHWVETKGTGVCVRSIDASEIAKAVTGMISSGQVLDKERLRKIFEVELNMEKQAEKLLSLVSRSNH